MPYQTPITIKESVQRIQRRELVLPAIQREFVWGAGQIEQLFDSLLRGYPISTFLFWQVRPDVVSRFQWYEFLSRYHARSHKHNTLVPPLAAGQGFAAVLDGQQRLTSLYLGLCGSYATKLKNRLWKDDSAFPEKKLYVNLLEPASNKTEKLFDFRFLTAAEASAPVSSTSPARHWFRVGEVLSMDTITGLFDYINQHSLFDSQYSVAQRAFAQQTLTRLWQAVHSDGVISYYEEQGEELDKVLQIFIRINSGGTKLSYSDLLLSIATAEWQGGSARELIHGFVDELNNTGNRFRFDKDFVLKACLVLADITDVKFRVDNFSRTNMDIIQQKWAAIQDALRAAVKLVSSFGYDSQTLTATNALIPISYFLLANDFTSSIFSAARENDRKAAREWLGRVLLKRVFGGQPDGLYGRMRRLINDNSGRFPLAEIATYYRGRRKSIDFTSEELDNLLEMQYGKNSTLSLLNLLYANKLNQTFQYHIDHMHPKSRVRKEDLNDAGITDAAQIKLIQRQVNGIPNLQLLEGGANINKSNIPLAEWLAQKGTLRSSYELQHFMPPPEQPTLPEPAELSNFPAYYKARRELMRQELATILGVDLAVAATDGK